MITTKVNPVQGGEFKKTKEKDHVRNRMVPPLSTPKTRPQAERLMKERVYASQFLAHHQKRKEGKGEGWLKRKNRHSELK